MMTPRGTPEVAAPQAHPAAAEAGWPASPTGLTARAVLELGALGEGGEGEAWKDGSSAISVNSARRAPRLLPHGLRGSMKEKGGLG